MFARVTRYEGSPSEVEAGIKLIKETIAPGAKRLQGFKGGYWLLDRASGKGFSGRCLRVNLLCTRPRTMRHSFDRGLRAS